MKRTFLHLLILITFTSGIHAQTGQDNPTKHFFACTDYTRGWVYNDHTLLTTMSSIQILDLNGKPINGTVLH